MAILTGMRCYFIVVLICIFLTIIAFHMPIDHLYIFFGEMSILVFCSFFDWVFLFQVVCCSTPKCVWLLVTPWTSACQAPLFFTISWSLLNSWPLSPWCLPTISSSVIPFSSCPQSFPASGPFPTSWLFVSGVQSIGASVSASVLPMNIEGWFPLGLTGLISLQSKGLSRVFASTTIWKHQFFSAQPSLWFNFHISTWLLEKP